MIQYLITSQDQGTRVLFTDLSRLHFSQCIGNVTGRRIFNDQGLFDHVLINPGHLNQMIHTGLHQQFCPDGRTGSEDKRLRHGDNLVDGVKGFLRSFSAEFAKTKHAQEICRVMPPAGRFVHLRKRTTSPWEESVLPSVILISHTVSVKIYLHKTLFLKDIFDLYLCLPTGPG
jgi:hypothetical protein